MHCVVSSYIRAPFGLSQWPLRYASLPHPIRYVISIRITGPYPNRRRTRVTEIPLFPRVGLITRPREGPARRACPKCRGNPNGTDRTPFRPVRDRAASRPRPPAMQSARSIYMRPRTLFYIKSRANQPYYYYRGIESIHGQLLRPTSPDYPARSSPWQTSVFQNKSATSRSADMLSVLD